MATSPNIVSGRVVAISMPASLAPIERIPYPPERAVALDVIELGIRHRRLRRRVPVDQPLAAIDESFAIERDEDAPHGRR